MKKYLIIGWCTLLYGLLACATPEETAQEAPVVVLSSHDSAALERNPYLKDLVEANGIATLVPQNQVLDLGVLTKDTTTKHALKFTNTSKNPLIIHTIYASCPCARASNYPDTVAAGASGTIIVNFNTKGKIGAQAKTLTVRANTSPILTPLRIIAQIEEKKK
ncbi:MAG: DUF1573 domain-containing protein [Aureispira sp.]